MPSIRPSDDCCSQVGTRRKSPALSQHTLKRPEREGVMISEKVIFGLVALLYVAAIVKIFILRW